jgi:hypothetical protein
MSEQLVMKAIIDSVPQWYECDRGPNTYDLNLNGQIMSFCSQRPLTPDLDRLYHFARARLDGWMNQLPEIPTPSSISSIKQELALRWLKRIDEDVSWNKLIAYTEELCFRTYENDSVTLNIIITEGQGTEDITSKEIQKILDPMACTSQTYLLVDRNLNFLNYKEILWSTIEDSNDYKFSPEFLQPFKSVLREREYSLHLTRKGDIIIMSSHGLLTVCRKGQWYIYDAATLKNSIVDIIGNYRVGCNLFEIMLDLSYRRHGALLVYDPRHSVLENIVNRDSIIGGDEPRPDLARQIFSNSVRPIEMGHASHDRRKKRLFLEAACLDGAIVFDAQQVLAFGAMIGSHPDTGSHLGARTTAARSAYLWGGRPIKISADGDISVLFSSMDADLNSSDATLNFL